MMQELAFPSARALPSRVEIAARLASHPPLESLMTADDLEKQQLAASRELRPAAVLLLVVNHAEPAVVFTQRTAHLADHAGQISFPGGRCDEGDCTPERTALREAREEIGLEADRVQLLGRLPEYRTSTGFSVTPVVGWAEPPVSYRPDPHEVAEVFEVPLAFLLDSRNHRYESAFFKGRMRKYWAMPFGERFIWGATAGMLVTFQRILVAA
jgi:8-oxo-dGTP pyrophosphatase MutT (NUDIX family)